MVGHYIREVIEKFMIILSISVLSCILIFVCKEAYKSSCIFATDKIYEDVTIETVDDYVIFDDSFAEQNIDELNNCLDDIPVYMNSFLIDKGWKIKYVNCIDISEHDNDRTVGKMSTNNKVILIDITRTGKQTLYHELEHILDIYGRLDTKLEDLGVYEDSDEWNNIELKSDYWADYIESNYAERKAETYYTFVFYPNELKSQAPNIYQAYDNAYNSLHSSNMVLTSIETYITTFGEFIDNLF